MKSILKKINLLGVAALIIGATAAFTVKSPTEKQDAKQLYGRLSSGEWVNIESNPQRPCNASMEVCKAYFESQPATNAEPAAEDIVEDNGTLQ
jgi:hypothetical protein